MQACSFRHIKFAPALNLSTTSKIGPFAPLKAGQPSIAFPARSTQTLPESLSADEQGFVECLLHRAGLRLRDYRTRTFARRLPACLRELRTTSPAEALRRIEMNPNLAEHALSTLLLGVTSFFRDPFVFSTIRDTILPRLSHQSHPRIWSAACSNGAELLSVAMLLEERGDLDRCELHGTDVRAGAIRSATAGRYHLRLLDGLPDAMVAKYFMNCPTCNAHRIARHSLRRTMSWRRADALAGAEAGRWDLILCRNMAMYMQPQTSARLWRQLEDSLRPGGFLVVGKAEKPTDTILLKPFAPCIYRRMGQAEADDLNGLRTADLLQFRLRELSTIEKDN